MADIYDNFLDAPEPEDADKYDQFLDEPDEPDAPFAQEGPQFQGLPLGASAPISAITGQPVPTSEEQFAGARATLNVIPYGAASALRGAIPEPWETAVMQPVSRAITGRDYISPITTAQQVSGAQLPAEARQTIGTGAEFVGELAPLTVALKTSRAIMKAFGMASEMVIGNATVLERIAHGIMSGGLTGLIHGGLTSPDKIEQDIALFAGLEAGLGATGGIIKKVAQSNWFRKLAVLERSLVIQTADDLLKAGHSEAKIIKTLSNKTERAEFIEKMKRVGTEKARKTLARQVTPEEPVAERLKKKLEVRPVAPKPVVPKPIEVKKPEKISVKPEPTAKPEGKPVLISSSPRGSQLSIEFDNRLGTTPTVKEIKDYAKEKGFDVDVIRFKGGLKDEVTMGGIRDTTRYRIDVWKDGKLNSKAASELSEHFGGDFVGIPEKLKGKPKPELLEPVRPEPAKEPSVKPTVKPPVEPPSKLSIIPEFKSTQEAVKFGATATPEQLEQVSKKIDDFRSNLKEARKIKDFDTAMIEAGKVSIYDEAIRAKEILKEHPELFPDIKLPEPKPSVEPKKPLPVKPPIKVPIKVRTPADIAAERKVPISPDMKKNINELYAKAIEVADEAGNRKEVKRLHDELKFIGGTITLPSEMRKARQTIGAWANYKGLTKKQLTAIVKHETGYLSTKNKDVTIEQLRSILSMIAKARPGRIGYKTVVSKATESRIKTLKKNLMDRAEMSEEIYSGILESLRIKDPRYISKYRFITESKGKEVIKSMLKAVPIAKMQAAVDVGVKDKPAVKLGVEKLKEHFKKTKPDIALKKIKLASTLDMHHFADKMEKETGQPFGQLNERISDKKHELDWIIDQKIDAIRKAGGKDFINITKNPESLKRINNYIASRLPKYIKGKPIRPTDITNSEISVAEAIIKRLKEHEGNVRYNRFYEWREHGVEIPNAPKKELMRATKILETEGDSALRKWLADRDWGVIRSGYDIGEVINPSIQTTRIQPGFGKVGLRARESIKYHKSERDILRRFASYERQMTYRTEMKPLIDAWTELFKSNKHLFADPRKVAELLSRNIRERLGQKQDLQVFEEYIIRTYSQAARAIFLDVRKGVRNLFQNLAFYTSIGDLIKMKKLSPADKKYFDIYVSQEKGIARDWLYQDYEGIPGLKQLNEMADSVNVMGRTDTANRLLAYKMKLEAVRSAIKKYPKYKTDTGQLTAMMKKSGWGDIEPMERLHALNTLATDGEDAMARYVANATTKKVHFLYERSERSPAEQGSELSRVASNLLTFRKGYVQRTVLDLKKLMKKEKEIEAPIAGRRRSIRSITGMIVMGTIAGWIYQKVTGHKRNPYSPVSVIGNLSLGGLATGMQEQIGDFTNDVMNAATGDEKALARVINGIPRVADSFIPFYNEVMYVIEGLSDHKNIDAAVLRQIRSKLDYRYKAKPMGYYKALRTKMETAQHIVFGTEPAKGKKKKTGGYYEPSVHKPEG